ncbi:MAG: serine hydrolase, partial [Acidobacteriota bacterium]
TAVDSHVALPVVTGDRERLEAIELAPFRAAVAAGVDSVMLGHIAVPELDASGAPATLSPALSHGLLRDELGFEGLVVTDAMEMAGVRPAWTGGAAIRAVQAGADVILMPPDARVAVQSLVRAVREGQLTEARLDASVRHILATKARLGLHRERLVDPAAIAGHVARPEDVERAHEIARRAITVVRNEGDILPLAAERPLRLLHLVLSDRLVYRSTPADELEARGIDVRNRYLGPDVSAAVSDEIVAGASDFSHILVSAFVRSVRATALAASHERLLDRLQATGKPVIFVAMESPYALAAVPDVPVAVCAFGGAVVSQRAAIGALFGEFDLTGRLPVSLPMPGRPGYPEGYGLRLPRRAMSLVTGSPEEAGFRPEGLATVDQVIRGFLAQGAFPGGVLAVGRGDRLVHLRAFGRFSSAEDAPPVRENTIYDLASLTKVVATTTMAMILVDEERLELDARVVDFLPGFAAEGVSAAEQTAREAVTVRHLLTHTSGIDWWSPLYQELQGKQAYLERIQAMDLVYEPGSRTKYSDLGIILLGEILERVAGEPMDAFLERRLFRPLGMNDTGFLPPPERLARIAPTEQDPWRGRLLHGEVHDENAHALGGVAPHAGLFGTASDLARFARMLLNGGVFEHRRLISRATVETFTRRQEGLGEGRGLGWDIKSPRGSTAGSLFSASSFGHTGFTGTSLWIDPERELFVILLTNRVHPSRDNKLIREVRPAVADAVVQALAEDAVEDTEADAVTNAAAPTDAVTNAATPNDATPNEATPNEATVQLGLERLEAKPKLARHMLGGKRLGLVVHAASQTAAGRHAIDVLRDQGLEVKRLFSPEHGLRSRAAAGEKVADGLDPVSGLPVISLYGERRQPTAEDLDGLDALVIDLQGAGVRFYTYVSTLILCLEAASEAGLEVTVLDRPNPLGGERLAGPLSAPRETVPASFVNLAPGTLVHGLTLGEMARFVNARLPRPVKLQVLTMIGWRRSMTWRDTGLPWVPPSPNLRTPEAALAYPGVALLEATNVSEGRGTEAPFLYLGAPWLDETWLDQTWLDQTWLEDAAPRVPGFELTATRFTPRGSPAAPRPKHLDEDCSGLQIHVSDPETAEPYRLGLELLASFSRHPQFAWRSDGALTRLLGNDRVARQLAAGETVAEILAADAEDHAAWRLQRAASLLYLSRY